MRAIAASRAVGRDRKRPPAITPPWPRSSTSCP